MKLQKAFTINSTSVPLSQLPQCKTVTKEVFFHKSFHLLYPSGLSNLLWSELTKQQSCTILLGSPSPQADLKLLTHSSKCWVTDLQHHTVSTLISLLKEDLALTKQPEVTLNFGSSCLHCSLYHTWFMQCWGLNLGFVHAKQALCQLNHIPCPTLIS